MRTKIIRSLRKEGIRVHPRSEMSTAELAWTLCVVKAQLAAEAVNWDYVAKWAAIVIFFGGCLFLTIHLTISNLRMGH